MTRALALVFGALALVSCAGEPTAVDYGNRRPALTVGGSNAGGVTFAAGSGCTVVLSHFECSFTAEGVGSDLYQIMQLARWTYTYQCVHRKTGRPSRTPPAVGLTSAGVLQSLTGSNDQITVSGTVLAPVAPVDCAANKGAYTATQMLSGFTANSWSLLVQRDSDPNNFFASLFEVL